MYIDLLGKKRQKVGLHIHTNLSDGKCTPAEMIEIYKAHGYDALAITDHWRYQNGGEINGVKVISGAEYDVGGRNTERGVYHILSLFSEREPELTKGEESAQSIIDGIHKAGGLAVLAHPAWSLNTPEMIMALAGVDATEIYNAVSEKGQSFRADSSILVDMVASRGMDLPLLATDDVHYYEGVDNCKGYIMVEAESAEPTELKKAILERRFYATQGPEIHMWQEGGKFKVLSSPVSRICFASNTAWCVRSTEGKEITCAEYTPVASDLFVRAFAVDENGKTAWSNIVMLK